MTLRVTRDLPPIKVDAARSISCGTAGGVLCVLNVDARPVVIGGACTLPAANGADEMALSECWAVQDFEGDHWIRLVRQGDAHLIDCSDHAATRTALDRIASIARDMLRSERDRRQGVLDALRAITQR